MPDALSQLRQVGARVNVARAPQAPDPAIDRLRTFAQVILPDLVPIPDEIHERERDERALRRAAAADSTPRTSRWWCEWCGAFARGEYVPCAKCAHTGPHHFGEDHPLAGSATRRARLRADRKRRGRNPQ